MEILLLLIPLSVVLVFMIGAGFWWCVQTGQFDDLEGPAHRILADDDSADPMSEVLSAVPPAVPAGLTSIKNSQRDRP